MRENRRYGSEGGEVERPFLPLPSIKPISFIMSILCLSPLPLSPLGEPPMAGI